MKYDLIFYISKKTSYCERSVRRALSKIDGEPRRIVGAVTPVELGDEVARCLKVCPMAVIVGGLSSDYDDNLANVLSRVFSNSTLTLENMRRLNSDSGARGYIIRYKSQILLALPDSPDGITELFTDELLSFISDKLSPEETKPAESSDAESEASAETTGNDDQPQAV